VHIVSRRPVESAVRNEIWAGDYERWGGIFGDIGSRFLIALATMLRPWPPGWARMSQRTVKHPPGIALASLQS